ncbi:hypothetical protein ACFFMN_05875 [Planobispora siamensis]|uniref:Uncharacterized protein n=1 Tax=Planobispora siamensis TaxID=936338 RepID=A0A8J3SRD4_9ACTN|nr:hypothetical protein [Planobispora siamensis]GIH94288.1 hypothetical protein Psi01_49180 [Planobispora siamensis]
MADTSISDGAPQPADIRWAGTWLQRHGLGDGPPTPLLTARLAVRGRVRVLDSVLQAVLIIAASLAQVAALPKPADRSVPVLVLSVLVVVLLLARALLDAWVRRVDRRAGAALARRATHSMQPGLWTLLGWPYVVLAGATFAGAFALGVSALAVAEGIARHAAVVLLVAVTGVALGVALQLREILARPVVAEDEASLTADVVMRIEDARESAVPTVLWSLPVVLLFGFMSGWWNAASMAFVVLGALAFIAVRVRAPSCAATARQAVGLR